MENEAAFHDFEHEGWQRVAGQYGPGFGAVTRQAVDPILAAAGAGNGIRLLDVACGPGYVVSAAALAGCSVIGMDFSSSMIDIARENNPGIEFREGDAENLDFPDNSFDAVTMNFGMLHLARPGKAIAEAFRVLRAGGRFAFTVWDAPPKTAGFEIVLDSIQRHGTVNVDLPEGPSFFRFSDPEECRSALIAAGFERIKSIAVPMVWVMQSGSEIFVTMRRAAVRTAALLNKQTPGALANIEKEISARAERYRTPRGIELPMPAILTSAAKIQR